MKCSITAVHYFFDQMLMCNQLA